MTVSPAMQDYLAETYRLAHQQPAQSHVSTSALAEMLHVSAPAVTRMVARLKDAGYLNHEPYQGIQLTLTGERAALLSIRKHRLVERFLVDVMGFGWHEVHDAADELGGVVSDTVVARMERMAGYPRRCPHGEPIPDASGVMPTVRDMRLTDAQPGVYRISRVNSHDEARLKYLDSLALKPGIRFELVECAPFKGPLYLRVGEQVHPVGYELATTVRVCGEAEFELA
ncbi:MAG: metal-dependent transcriptional regulator [Armatimonadetes bacterium]|nr:metal-dependent transcriptional regulator [Anaerolineae bacterium]